MSKMGLWGSSKHFWLKNWQSILGFLCVLVVLLAVLSFLSFIEIKYSHNIIPKNRIEEHDLAYYILAIALTVIIAYIAWFQLQNISKQQEIESKFQKAQFLLDLDVQYSNKNILSARIIFHEIYVKTAPSAKSLSHHLSLVAQEIIAMEEDPCKVKKFVLLLNFINCLETISFFIEKKFVTTEYANELLGGTLKFFFEAFKPVIEHRREKFEDINYFKNFELVYAKIKSLNPNSSNKEPRNVG